MTTRPISAQNPQIWLASGSPRRRTLLEQMGFAPQVRTSDIEERAEPGERPQAYATRLARSKGQSVRATLEASDRVEGSSWLLAADTIVVCDALILEKPTSVQHAYALLQQLSGRQHEVITAFWLGDVEGTVDDVQAVVTKVVFAPLEKGEIERYIATGEPMDKAGAYGIQGVAGAFVTGIEGSYSNVVGLPIHRVMTAMKMHGAIEGFPL